jgi:hypothetical protein
VRRLAVLVEIQYSQPEYLEAIEVARRRAPVPPEALHRRVIRGVLKAVAILALPYSFVIASIATHPAVIVGATVIACGGLAIFTGGLAKLMFRFLPPQQKWRDGSPHTYEITDAGLRHQSGGISVIWPWKSIRQIDRHLGFVLIHFDTTVLALPESQFSNLSTVGAFVSELRRRVSDSRAGALSPWTNRWAAGTGS